MSESNIHCESCGCNEHSQFCARHGSRDRYFEWMNGYHQQNEGWEDYTVLCGSCNKQVPGTPSIVMFGCCVKESAFPVRPFISGESA